MTAQAQLVLDAKVATGRSVQVIKPFMHSSTHLSAFYVNSLCKVTPVHHCTLIVFILLAVPQSFIPSDEISWYFYLCDVTKHD